MAFGGVEWRQNYALGGVVLDFGVLGAVKHLFHERIVIIFKNSSFFLLIVIFKFTDDLLFFILAKDRNIRKLLFRESHPWMRQNSCWRESDLGINL
jgi:hypothetical protein